MPWRRSLLVAWLVTFATLAACSGDNQSAQPEIVTAVTSPSTIVPATTIPTTAAPATTLMPPPFKARAAAETREEEWQNVPGSASRECVDIEKFQHLARQVGPNARDLVLDLRSGEWVAGNFYDLAHAVGVAPSGTLADPIPLKIYWIGLARDLQTPIITARSLSDPALPPVRGTTGSGTNSRGTFTPSGVLIPVQGRWRITAASTDQWGCYDLEL
jgi:hypothetical protein